MLPIPLIFWALLAAAAALYSGQTHALGTEVTPLQMLGETYDAAHKARPALTVSTPGGISVAKQADALIRASAARTLKIPLTAKAILPKARATAGIAAMCIAFPPRCAAGLILTTLGTDVVLDALGRLADRSTLSYVFLGSGSSYHTPLTYDFGTACAAIYKNAPFKNGRVRSTARPWPTNTIYDQALCEYDDVSVTPNVVKLGAAIYQCNGSSPTACNSKTPSSPLAQVDLPFTEAELNGRLTASSKWQDGSFAAVFGEAVTKGATWPITTFDGAEMVAGPADAVATETSTITGPAGTTTRTTTTTATATTSGTTVGDAKATITKRTTTVETGPAGTTTTATDTAPEVEGEIAEQVDSGTAPVEVEVQFPEPVFSETVLPEVPDLYEQKYPNGLAGVWAEKGPQLMATTFITSVQGMFPTLSGSGSCPVWQINLNFGAMGNFGTGDISPPCWIWGAVALIFLTSACFTAWRIIFG